MLLVVAGAGGYWLYQRLDGNIQAAGIDNKIGGDRPANLSSGAMNILVVGSDSRDGDNAEYGKGLTTMQADTLMVLHIAANRKWAAVVSLPRDSWVQIPACDRGNAPPILARRPWTPRSAAGRRSGAGPDWSPRQYGAGCGRPSAGRGPVTGQRPGFARAAWLPGPG
ncbi:LCP family protein [Streptomyces sp. NPDC059175]|uniref:LCP family protein n=1 Tax=Streptomyces sp. NPDC059175 TaxID=3346757 RepID=UPI0036C14D01